MWNFLQLKCPVEDICEYRIEDGLILQDLPNLVTLLSCSAEILTEENPIWTEMEVLKIVQLKYKEILHCDKCVQLLQRVGTCLRKMVLLKLSKSYLDLAEHFLVGLQTVGLSLYLPSRQQLEYILLRTQSAAKLICEALHYSRETFCYLIQRLKVGHIVGHLMMAISVTARINILFRGILVQIFDVYRKLYSWHKKLKVGTSQWPQPLNLPDDLETWLTPEELELLNPQAIPQDQLDFLTRYFNKENGKYKSEDADKSKSDDPDKSKSDDPDKHKSDASELANDVESETLNDSAVISEKSGNVTNVEESCNRVLNVMNGMSADKETHLPFVIAEDEGEIVPRTEITSRSSESTPKSASHAHSSESTSKSAPHVSESGYDVSESTSHVKKLSRSQKDLLKRIMQTKSVKGLRSIWNEFDALNVNSFPCSLTPSKIREIDKLFKKLQRKVSVVKSTEAELKHKKQEIKALVKITRVQFARHLDLLVQKPMKIKKETKTAKTLKTAKTFKELRKLFNDLYAGLKERGDVKKCKKLKKIFKSQSANIKLLLDNKDIVLAKNLICCTSKIILTKFK